MSSLRGCIGVAQSRDVYILPSRFVLVPHLFNYTRPRILKLPASAHLLTLSFDLVCRASDSQLCISVKVQISKSYFDICCLSDFQSWCSITLVKIVLGIQGKITWSELIFSSDWSYYWQQGSKAMTFPMSDSPNNLASIMWNWHLVWKSRQSHSL